MIPLALVTIAAAGCAGICLGATLDKHGGIASSIVTALGSHRGLPDGGEVGSVGVARG